MAVVSKHATDEFLKHSCQLYHPRTTSCVVSFLDMCPKGLVGTFKFFSVIHLLQLLINRKKINKEYLKKEAQNFVRVLLWGSSYGPGFVTWGCFFRNLLGKFYWGTLAFLPAFFAGYSIYFLQPKDREFYTFTVATMSTYYLIRKLEKVRVLTITKSGMCWTFMMLSASIMYLLRTAEKGHLPAVRTFWFFNPPIPKKLGKDEAAHYHKDECWRYAIKDAGKYFGFGVAIQMLRKLLTSLHKLLQHPLQFLLQLLSWKNFGFGVFLFAYVAVYHGIICALSHYKGEDSAWYSLPAGFLAGSMFLLNPKVMHISMAMATIGEQIVRRGIALEVVPRSGFLMCTAYTFFSAICFHSRVTDSDLCPQFIRQMMSGTTEGRCDDICAHVEQLRKNLRTS